MFEPVSPKTNFPELEEQVLAFWNAEKVFEKSLDRRRGCKEYIFYDGPPFATGKPHYGHLLAGTIKDIVPRYWAMQGYYVDRRFGWDCHGLPVENEAAKDLKELEGLDLSGKYEIEEYGIAKFNEYCRSIVLKYTAEWETVVKRMGRWVDFQNCYRTMDKGFMESVWWVFKQLWDKGMIYQGHRVMPFSWKLSTPLSNFEAKSNYKDVQDPAITVKFKLDDEDAYVLAWTTTPWTLPSNLALAIGRQVGYVKVRDGETGEVYYLAEARLAFYEKKLKRSFEVLGQIEPAALVGRGYQPLFPFFAELKQQGAFRVIFSGHVSTEDGSGVVHMAPAFGEDDFEACRAEGIAMVNPVDMEGRFTAEVPDWQGVNVKDADKDIIRRLKEEHKLLLQDTIVHSYPFCWRSDTPLIYRAISTWFCQVEPLKDRLVANNEKITWVPESVGSNRFGNWLADARDWNISRNRYWGTPIPIWESEDGERIAFGSAAELEAVTGRSFDDLHSHFLNEVTFERDGKIFRRIPEVFDCWFESGAMPYAQINYPREQRGREFPQHYADFIAEGLDQTRGWFYTLHVLSTALFDAPAFKNVVVNGLILAEDGSKMSKSKKNYPDPMLILNTYGADCLRSYLINSPVVRAEPLRFSEKGIETIYRSLVSPLWNAYSFFVTYARLDNYQPQGQLTGSRNELDVWIISHLQTLIAEVTRHMQGNRLYSVVPELMNFVDMLTNWYIRRSRRRFWRAETDADKADAYNTLYYVLTTFSKVMAPFMPFLCEAIYRNLVRGQGEPESVHLCDYPVAEPKLVDGRILEEMDYLRELVELGRSLRAAHNLKTRQPLAKLSVVVDDHHRQILERLDRIVLDELNVKALEYLHDETELITYSARPNLKELGPRLGKDMKTVTPAIRELTHADVARLLAEGRLAVAGHELLPGDVLIDRQEKAGMVVMASERLTIALDTELTDDLRLECDARELVNRIANQRKDSGFNVEDRIQLRFEGDDLSAVLAAHGDYIRNETLATTLADASFQSESSQSWEVNDKRVVIHMARLG